MIQAAFNSVVGYDDGIDEPKTSNDGLKQKDQAGCWTSMKREFLAMETTG
jgi:hypothetical protein